MALAALVLTQAGCLACNDIGCGGGFEWVARPDDGSAVVPGAYTLEVTLEQTRYQVDCTIADTVGDSDCTEPTRLEGDGDFDLFVQLEHIDPDEWNPDGPTGGFRFMAADHSGSEPDGSYSETRGPTEVAIAVTRDGQALFDVDYALTYERDDEFYGDDRCGYCEELQQREHAFAQ